MDEMKMDNTKVRRVHNGERGCLLGIVQIAPLHDLDV
jgi:hypothetical protein